MDKQPNPFENFFRKEDERTDYKSFYEGALELRNAFHQTNYADRETAKSEMNKELRGLKAKFNIPNNGQIFQIFWYDDKEEPCFSFDDVFWNMMKSIEGNPDGELKGYNMDEERFKGKRDSDSPYGRSFIV